MRPDANLGELPLRPELVGDEPYGAPQLDVPVRLNVNENPYPPSAQIVAEMAQAVAVAAAQIDRYPDREALNLRADLHGSGVRVSCIEPGLCGGTEFSNVRFHGDDARAANVYAGVQPLSAEDIAESVHWIATLPAHVNVNSIELMPVAQSFGGLTVHRD